MKQFFVTVFGSIIGVIIGSILTLFLLFFGLIGLFASIGANASENTGLPAGRMVLEIDLREPRLDQPSRSPFAFAEAASLVDLVRLIDRAEGDDRVAGLFIRANEFGMGAAQAEEINRAIAGFSETGRPVIVHSQGFSGTSVTNYLAVASADEIWLQDTANFSSAGLSGELAFFGEALERIEADADFIRFFEYKNGPNGFTESGFTPEHLESTLSYFESIYGTAIAQSAIGRGVDAAALQALIESAPHSAEVALEAGLVDQLGHVSAAREAAIRLAGGNVRMADIEDYRLSGVLARTGPRIALVEGQGTIVTGAGLTSPFGGEPMIGGDALAEAISAAAESNPEAIILRIDSGGGSSIASDQIWDAMRRAREDGIPVVVSMGGAAASGGYYIAAPADHIVANAATITGSIGVYGGKIDLGETFGLLGVNFEQVSVGGEFASAYSGNERWSETQRAAVEQTLADIYEDFTSRVAEGRELSREHVGEIARGRVWTGEQALEHGLVDEIGGFMDAVAAARDLAGIAEGQSVNLQRFPREQTPFEAFQELFGVSAEGAQSLAQLNALMNTPEFQALIETRQASQPGQELRGNPVTPQ